MDFQVGDQVKLNTDLSPVMLVESIETLNGQQMVSVVWFDDSNNTLRDKFLSVLLTKNLNSPSALGYNQSTL